MRRALLILALYLALPAVAAHCVEISVNASASVGPVNKRIFGHNTQHQNGCHGLWNAGQWKMKDSAEWSNG